MQPIKSHIYSINLPPTFQIWLILLFEIAAVKFLNLNPKKLDLALKFYILDFTANSQEYAYLILPLLYFKHHSLNVLNLRPKRLNLTH